MINIALLVGSDYTEGIENVGIVKAMEILQEFEGNGLEKLKNFKKWYDEAQNNLDQKENNKLKKILRKLKVPNSFPSEVVVNAYLNPNIDKSSEEFSWSLPNLDLIRKFCISKMSWSSKKIDDDLLPLIKKINETTVQSSIEAFFNYQTTSSFSKQSQRMKNAINSFKRKNSAQNNKKSDLVSYENSFSRIKNDDLNLSEDDEVPLKQKKQTKSSIKITSRKKNK